MTTARQTRRIFSRLVKKHDDIAQIDKYWLCIKPFHHVMCRVILDRTGSSERCNPKFYLTSAFLNNASLEALLGFDFYINRPLVRAEQSWLWADPVMEEELVSMIETETLPLLRRFVKVEHYAAYYRERCDRYWFMEWKPDRLLVDIALGDLESARRIWADLPQSYHDGNNRADGLYFQIRWAEILRTIREPLFADDRTALAGILHGWEADNVRRAGYERYWEPTPFPLERTVD